MELPKNFIESKKNRNVDAIPSCKWREKIFILKIEASQIE